MSQIKNDNQYIVEGTQVYQIMASIAFIVSREDFLEKVREIVTESKKEGSHYKQFDKIFVCGKINGKDVQVIHLCNKTGEIMMTVTKKEEQNGV